MLSACVRAASVSVERPSLASCGRSTIGVLRVLGGVEGGHVGLLEVFVGAVAFLLWLQRLATVGQGQSSCFAVLTGHQLKQARSPLWAPSTTATCLPSSDSGLVSSGGHAHSPHPARAWPSPVAAARPR